MTTGGRCISSVRSGSAEATAPASTLPGEVQIPRCHAHFREFRAFADLNGPRAQALHRRSLSHEAVSKWELEPTPKESYACADFVLRGRLGSHLKWCNCTLPRESLPQSSKPEPHGSRGAHDEHERLLRPQLSRALHSGRPDYTAGLGRQRAAHWTYRLRAG